MPDVAKRGVCHPRPATYGTQLAAVTKIPAASRERHRSENLARKAVSARRNACRRRDEFLALLRSGDPCRVVPLRRAWGSGLRRSAGGDRLHLARLSAE